MSFPLDDRVCLITGGASGIGKATATALLDAGAKVFVADISTERMDELVAEVQSPNLHVSCVDVGDFDAVKSWVDEIDQNQGGVDVLVHCAIYVDWTPVDDQSIDAMSKTVQVGLIGLMCCTKAVLPAMKRGGFGRIVYVSSIASTMQLFPGYAAYAAVKAATDAWTNELQLDLRDTPIQVANVRPGIVGQTNLFREAVDRHHLPRLLDFLPKTTPERVAGTILRAVSKSNRTYVTPPIYRMLDFVCRCTPRLSRWMCRWGTSRRRDIVMRDDDER